MRGKVREKNKGNVSRRVKIKRQGNRNATKEKFGILKRESGADAKRLSCAAPPVKGRS